MWSFWWQVVDPSQEFYRPQAPDGLLARPVIGLEQGLAWEGRRTGGAYAARYLGRERKGRMARWVEPPSFSLLHCTALHSTALYCTALMHSGQTDRQTILPRAARLLG